MDVTFRHGVKSAFMPRVAFAQPLYGKPATVDNAMSFNRFHGVICAAGIKPAILSEPGADQHFVSTQQQHHNFSRQT